MRKKVDHTGLAETRQHKANMRTAASLAEIPQGKISSAGQALIEGLAEAGYMNLIEPLLPKSLKSFDEAETATVGTAVKEPQMPDAANMAKVKKLYKAWQAEMLPKLTQTS